MSDKEAEIEVFFSFRRTGGKRKKKGMQILLNLRNRSERRGDAGKSRVHLMGKGKKKKENTDIYYLIVARKGKIKRLEGEKKKRKGRIVIQLSTDSAIEEGGKGGKKETLFRRKLQNQRRGGWTGGRSSLHLL